jgi:hypothetical protein
LSFEHTDQTIFSHSNGSINEINDENDFSNLPTNPVPMNDFVTSAQKSYSATQSNSTNDVEEAKENQAATNKKIGEKRKKPEKKQKNSPETLRLIKKTQSKPKVHHTCKLNVETLKTLSGHSRANSLCQRKATLFRKVIFKLSYY